MPRTGSGHRVSERASRERNFRGRILAVVGRIPKGRVATYGQVALLAGSPRGARQVGCALRGLPEGSGLPWHRVLNASGRVSVHPDPLSSQIQRCLLEAEGVVFDPRDRVDLDRWGWHPRPSRKAGKRKGTVR